MTDGSEAEIVFCAAADPNAAARMMRERRMRFIVMICKGKSSKIAAKVCLYLYD